MIKLCIFDMDGLLTDSERFMWDISMREACKNQGFCLTDELHDSYRGMNFKSLGELLQREFGPKFDYELFTKDTNEINSQIIEKGIPLRPGVLNLLHYLKEHNIKTCIGTTTPRKVTSRIIEVIGITSLFDDIVCGDEIANGKPAPDIYLTCLSKFKGVDKAEALVFEDGESGGLAALAAGIRLVLVPDKASLSLDTKNKAYKIVDCIDKIIPTINEENS